MASLALSATTGGARKHAWTNNLSYTRSPAIPAWLDRCPMYRGSERPGKCFGGRREWWGRWWRCRPGGSNFVTFLPNLAIWTSQQSGSPMWQVSVVKKKCKQCCELVPKNQQVLSWLQMNCQTKSGEESKGEASLFLHPRPWPLQERDS